MSQIVPQPPIALIPESAPFNDEQRAWLNGFFAGWMGLAGNESRLPPVAEAPVEPLVDDETFPWHDPALPIVERIELARDRPLPRRLMAAMAQLDCGACGYVCRTYAEKLAAGEETCLTLCSPGGKETSKALKQFLKDARPNDARPSRDELHVTPDDAPGTRRNPVPAVLLRAVDLNGAGSDKQTMHVELDLGDHGLTYDVGDSLGVFPTNCEALVEEILAQLGATGEEFIAIDGEERSLFETLRSRRCLAGVTGELLECLAAAAGSGSDGDALRLLIDDDDSLDGCDVLDVLHRFSSVRPAPAAFAAALAPLRPRLYSISSSLKAHPGQVHLTVGRVAWQQGRRTRKGVCSTLFADRLTPGETVPVFVQKSHGFTVPADAASPMIMIGPGTGIAPFRAFLEERAATGATGANWLFFGDRREATDLLYRDELAAWQTSGLLTRLDLAFSRDGDAKVYVQDRLRENAAELWHWLSAGGSVFVCGDAKRMAVDVDRTLQSIVAEQGGLSSEAARDYLTRLAETGRYCRDVY